jgi:hypothetical protein
MPSKTGSTRDRDMRLFRAEEQSDGSYKTFSGNIRWYNAEGQLHREDGPAVLYSAYNRDKINWWVKDVKYSFDEWCIEMNKTDEEKMLLRLQYG